ncbi:MAG: hypothetical protein KDI78_01830 [Xanthomonadales bacterium]|nr:hypothetical protein [Xanthomonadales bacterium]
MYRTEKEAAAHAGAAAREETLAVLTRVFLDHLKAVLGHEAGAGIDVVARQYAVTVVVGEHDHRQIGLQERLLVDAPLDDAGLDALDDVGAQIEGAEIDLSGHAVFLKRQQRRVGEIEARLPVLEKAMSDNDVELADPALYADQSKAPHLQSLLARGAGLREEKDALEAEWLTLHEALEASSP